MNLLIEEHKFTSTGIKWWRHQESMMNYMRYSNTVISTHKFGKLRVI